MFSSPSACAPQTSQRNVRMQAQYEEPRRASARPARRHRRQTTRAVHCHRDIRTWFDKFEVPGRPRDVVAMLIFQDDAIATRIL
jgi:hypothetical protein